MCEVIGKTASLRVEVQHSINGVWNAGEVCKYCIIDAVNQADDRPTCVPANVSSAPDKPRSIPSSDG